MSIIIKESDCVQLFEYMEWRYDNPDPCRSCLNPSSCCGCLKKSEYDILEATKKPKCYNNMNYQKLAEAFYRNYSAKRQLNEAIEKSYTVEKDFNKVVNEYFILKEDYNDD